MKYLFIILILVISSCILPRESPIVNIKNDTNETFSQIKVFSNSIDNPTEFHDVSPREIVKGKIKFKEEDKSDGGYLLFLFKSDSIYKKYGFGYYTNGASLDREFNIIIKNDTIIIK